VPYVSSQQITVSPSIIHYIGIREVKSKFPNNISRSVALRMNKLMCSLSSNVTTAAVKLGYMYVPLQQTSSFSTIAATMMFREAESKFSSTLCSQSSA